MMNGVQLMHEIERHGGLVEVHTRQTRRGCSGWANTLICKDGWKYTTTARQDRALIKAQRERDGDD